MRQQLGSEHARHRLFWAMSIIIISLLMISVPLIVNSYLNYKKTESALGEILVLQDLAELANNISRERAPANNVMSSSDEDLDRHLAELNAYRKKVDAHMSRAIIILRNYGFSTQADMLANEVSDKLLLGRTSVDVYAATPRDKRTVQQLNAAIKKMFTAWDVADDVLKDVVYNSVGRKSAISESYTLVLLLTDMRDQAGRIASSIMPAVIFNEAISEENIGLSFQNQHQVRYLWKLINTLQTAEQRTPEYSDIHKRVQTEFLNKAIPIVAELIQQSRTNQPYSMTGGELTQAMVDKFATVIELQNYILRSSLNAVERDHNKAFRQFLFTLTVSIISLFAAIFTLVYARKTIFTPLIEARQKILELSQTKQIFSYPLDKDSGKSESLFGAISKLQTMLQQRDVLEFQLRNIANTDVLTGVSNRLALNEYIRLLEMRPEKLSQTGLIILDVDDFKNINDRFGHIIGDEVIRFIAKKLKENVRPSDLIVRYGGDEFIIIIDHTELNDAIQIAEAIRFDICNEEFYLPEINDFVKVTVSAGVAVGANSWMALLERADKALLSVKAKTKNAVSG